MQQQSHSVNHANILKLLKGSALNVYFIFKRENTIHSNHFAFKYVPKKEPETPDQPIDYFYHAKEVNLHAIACILLLEGGVC